MGEIFAHIITRHTHNAFYVQLPISLSKTPPLPKNDRLSRVLPAFWPPTKALTA
jgi:hypothetical protein